MLNFLCISALFNAVKIVMLTQIFLNCKNEFLVHLYIDRDRAKYETSATSIISVMNSVQFDLARSKSGGTKHPSKVIVWTNYFTG